MSNKILILGGYGNAGILIASLLLKYTSENIVLAGRNRQKAEAASESLNSEYQGNRVSAVKVDAANEVELTKALEDSKFLIVASSSLEFSKQVINSAITAEIDYLDIQLSSPPKLDLLNSNEKRIKDKGLCFITDGGFHPGIPAAMVRYAATEFEEIISANVYSYLNLDWKSYSFSSSTALEMISEFSDYNSEFYSGGKWKKPKWSEYKKFDFGNLIGKQYTAPMMLEEMRILPEEFSSLNETGFFVGGFNWFVNYISIPLIIPALKISKRTFIKPASKLFEFGLNNFSKPPFICILILEARVKKNGKDINFRMEISHPDGYLLTAVPVVSCLLQYFDGSIRKPGLHFQASLVEPKRFFNDVKSMGINLTVKHS